MTKTTVKDGRVVLAFVLRKGSFSKGLNFYSDDLQPLQLATWKYEKGRVLKAHAHKKARRINFHVQELVFIKSGRLRADIYSEKYIKVRSVLLKAGDILVTLAGGHGYKVLEEGTEVLEVKNGPYIGLERDKLLI